MSSPRSHASKPHSRDLSATQRKVLTCLKSVALEKGLDALSMRDVAKRADLTLASLQYHFPSKANLLKTFVEDTIETLRSQIETLLAVPSEAPKLPRIARAALLELTDTTDTHVLSMIWARSLHDPSASSPLEALMEVYLSGLTEIVQSDYPNLQATEAQRAAVLILALLEGCSTALPAAQARGLETAPLIETTIQTIQDIPRLISAPASGSVLS